MKRQDIFDKVYRHLLKQNSKALLKPHRKDQMDSCAYISKSGLKCAVGCLIDKAHYDAGFEGRCLSDARVTNAVLKSNKGLRLAGTTLVMLTRLQDVHDENKPAVWAEKLAELAKDFKLKIPN